MTLRLPPDLDTMARQLSAGMLAGTDSHSHPPHGIRGPHTSNWCLSTSPPMTGRVMRLGGTVPAMSPELSYGRHTGPARWDARRAAVQVLLFLDQGRWYLPLTLRPSHLPRHAGQICFAGGVVEQGESLRECAWREWCEELGEPSTEFRWVGELPTTFVFASNFLVTPLVALADRRPQYQLNQEEVADVLELPLESLLRSELEGEHLEQRGPLSFRAPHFLLAGHRIWGATALILEMLATSMRRSLDLPEEADKTGGDGLDRFGIDRGGDIFRKN